MNNINSIMCCCGSGLGSSMMVAMNAERALSNLGINGVSVDHTTVSEVSPQSADLIIVGKDLGYLFKDYPSTIILDEIMNMDELTDKLKGVFNV